MATKQNTSHTSTHNKRSDFDINRVDYEWVAKTNNIKELKSAYDALEEDGYFPDLLKTVGEKIVSLDPAFLRRTQGEQKMSAEQVKDITDDLNSFLDTMNQTDTSLRSHLQENQENKSIYSNGSSTTSAANFTSPLATQIEQQKVAENERLKGNECVKSKDYAEAVKCYSRSIELNSTEPFTYANRAMAYLKLKEFKKVVEDADMAIKMKPGYLKAHHRRGRGYVGLNKYEMAIKDFRYILEQEPDNKEVNKDLQEARQALNTKLEKDTKSATETKKADEKKKNKFVRVAIEEESDEDEEEDENKEEATEDEPRIEEVGGTPEPEKKKKKAVNTIQSKFPLTTPKEIEEHSRLAKKQMQQGASDFMKKYEEHQKKMAKGGAKQMTEQQNTMDELAKEIAAQQLEREKLQKMQRDMEKEVEKARKNKEYAEKEVKEAIAAKSELAEASKKVDQAAVGLAKSLAEETGQKIDLPDNLKEVAAEAETKKEEPATVSTGLSEADLAKKEKQKPKVDKVLEKVESMKKEAAEVFKIGQYGEAVKAFKKAAEKLESIAEDFPLFKQEICSVEATIFNNIAACSKKELNSKMEIEYTSKVIDRAQYLTDKSVLVKAFLRRGLAYEQIEKFIQARDDMLRVKELQYDNRQAGQCLDRVKKALKQEYGDKVPEVKQNAPIKMYTPEKKQEQSPPQKKEETKPAAQAKKEPAKEPVKEEEPNVSVEELEKSLAKIKDEGNAEYKAKSFVMAASKFTEGINLYLKHEAICKDNKDLMTKVTQLYTNRCLSWHQIGNQADAFNDSNYVLEHIDSRNPKALFRRAHCYKDKQQLSLAIKDLELLREVDPKNPVAKKDLIELKAQIKNSPKIQEVEVKTEAKENTNQKEKEEESPKKTEQKSSKKTKTLDAETVNKAANLATQEAVSKVLQSVPQTAAGFEKDYNQIKKDSLQLFQYLMNIPVATVKKLFKTSEVAAEVFSGLLQALSKHGLESKDDCHKVSEFLVALSSASNFDMTLMFIDDDEKKEISKILEGMKKHSVKQTEFKKVYSSVI